MSLKFSNRSTKFCFQKITCVTNFQERQFPTGRIPQERSGWTRKNVSGRKKCFLQPISQKIRCQYLSREVNREHKPSGKLTCEWRLSLSPVIAGGAGDNAAGAIGMGAVEPGNAFLSLGTSGVYFVVNPTFLPSPDQGAHAFCHCIPNT